MFADDALSSVDFKSKWKKERSVSEVDCQTKEQKTNSVSVQSIRQKSHETQTDEHIEEDIQLYEDDSPELIRFIRKMEPLVIKELTKAKKCHAFDGYNVNWENVTHTVSVVHTLTHAAVSTEQLHVTGLSWNCVGSVIAVAFGRFDHEDWCTHKSALCTWNLDRRNMDPNKPNTTIDLSSCLTSIAYHPKKPSLIAGGTFNGEVIVWDTSHEDDMRIASSGIGDDSHREPVSRVNWVLDRDSKGSKYQIISTSSDGRILVWTLNTQKGLLKLSDGFVLLTESLPRLLRVKAKRGDQEMGVTCISFSKEDDTTFLIGSESGGIFKCSTTTRGTLASNSMCSVPLKSPVTFTYLPHDGPVYGVEFSPFHRNLFLSCGSDGTARLYSVLQTRPILTLEPGSGYLYSVKWSPVRPTVFAVATGKGQFLLFDLKANRSVPVMKLPVGSQKFPVYGLQFNPDQRNTVATGDGAGAIQIWRLNDEISKPVAKENDVLDELANTILE